MRRKIVLDFEYIEHQQIKAIKAYYGGNMPLFRRIVRFNSELQTAILTGLRNSMKDASWNSEYIEI